RLRTGRGARPRKRPPRRAAAVPLAAKATGWLDLALAQSLHFAVHLALAGALAAAPQSPVRGDPRRRALRSVPGSAGQLHVTLARRALVPGAKRARWLRRRDEPRHPSRIARRAVARHRRRR